MQSAYPLSSWLKLLVLAMTWGSSFYLMKVGLTRFPPSDVAAIRLAAAAAVLAPFALVRLGRLQRHQWPVVASVGLTGSLLPAFLFAVAQTQIASGIAGALTALTPLFTMLIAVVIFRQRVSRPTVTGLILGFLGTLLLLTMNADSGAFEFNSYALLIVLATLCYAINLNLIRSYLGNQSPLTITGVSLLLVLPVVIVYLAGPGTVGAQLQAGGAWWPFGAVALIGVAGTALALILFNHLVQVASAVFASSVTYLIPIVAMTLGTLSGEPLGLFQVVGLIIVLYGVWLANRRPPAPPSR